MYYQECERLATEQPTLRPLIAEIDQRLHSLGPAAVLRDDEFAAIMKQPADKVTGIFHELSRAGLLREERHAECPFCSMLNSLASYRKAVKDGDSFECSSCDQDMTRRKVSEVLIYRLNASAMRVAAASPVSTSAGAVSAGPGYGESLPQRVIDDPFRYTPLMRYYSQNSTLGKAQPLARRRVVFVLHFLLDLIPFVEACRRLGLAMENACFFFKEYPYPQRGAIAALLKQRGATVLPRSEETAYLRQLVNSPKDRVDGTLLVEDGGFLVPAVHQQFTALLPLIKGAVEQTTRGARNDEQTGKAVGGLKLPVLSVAKSQLKNTFEPPYIAEASIRNIRRLLPNLDLRGSSVAVLGYGAIGNQVAHSLRDGGAIVTVFDEAAARQLEAGHEGFQVADTLRNAVSHKKLVIGASGNRTVDAGAIAVLSHDCYVVSASSEQYEIDVDELNQQRISMSDLKDDVGTPIGTSYVLPSDGRTVHLIANGYPVNFWGSESMPEPAADLIMSLILLSLVEVALGNYSKPGLDSDAVNKIADKYKLSEKSLEFHNSR